MREMMRGLAVATVIAAAGCGGSGSQASTGSGTQPTSQSQDWLLGPDVSCGECTVRVAGQFMIGGHAVQVDLDATPGAGGAAATGTLSTLDFVANGPLVDGLVDTIVSCSRERGVLRAVLSGTSEAGRFTAVVTHGADPAWDSIALTGPATIPPTPARKASVLIETLDRCDVPCGEGQCLCASDHLTCEPCSEDPAPRPPPPPPPPPPPQPQL